MSRLVPPYGTPTGVRDIEPMTPKAICWHKFGVVSVGVVALGVAIIFLGQDATNSGHVWDRTSSNRVNDLEVEGLCGPAAVVAVCSVLGVDTDLREVAELSGFDGQVTSMHGLVQAAQALGLRAVGLAMPADELSRSGIPSIALVRRNHFLAVLSFAEGRFNVSDLGHSYWIGKDELERMYSGKVLVLSKGQDPDPHAGAKVEGPAIFFERHSHDFGLVEGSRTIRTVFRFRNEGRGTLIIDRVTSSCGCAATLLSDSEVPPGGCGEIKVALTVGGSSGKVQHSIYVHSNDPRQPVSRLSIAASVKEGIRISPSRIYLGQLRLKDIVRTRLTVFLPADQGVVLEGVVSSSPNIAVGDFRSGDAASRRCEIPITMTATGSLGAFSEKIVLKTTDGNTPRVEVPVEGFIVGPLVVFPERFFFGFVGETEGATARIRIRRREGEGLRITGFKTERGYSFALYRIIQVREGEEYEFELGLGAQAKPGLVKDVIHVFSNSPDQPELSIPVCGFVRESGASSKTTGQMP